MSLLLPAALRAIDASHHTDPRRTSGGLPFEWDHAERLTVWVRRLVADPSDTLLIAARGQHIERWTRPRSTYPEGRTGYLRWREDLKTFHADRVTALMAEAGYDGAALDRVRALITKKALRAGDAEGQALEDGLCLVFMETQFSDLKAKTPPDKLAEIVRKTWAKMSSAGQSAALSLPWSPDDLKFLEDTLAFPSKSI